MNILLKSAKIIAAGNKDLHLKKKDIWIKNGKIEKIATNIETEGQTKIIENKNLHVSAGWFDTGVSFGEPGYEERETIENGLLTAAKSGFTDVVLNPDSHPVPDSSSDIIFLKNAASKSSTALHPLGALTVKSESIDLAELFDMKNAGAVGFYDYKNPIDNPNLLKIALQYAQNFGGLVFSYPLDKAIAGKGIVNEGHVSTKLGLKGIPSLAEELQIVRDLFVLEYTGGKLHIPTISTANSVKLIAAAKKKNLDVTCSVAIHNLWHTDQLLDTFDSKYKVQPPLREKADTKALINGLKSGIIDFVTTDHRPINIEHKELEFDNAAYGAIGLESAFGILNQLFDTDTAIALLTKGRSRFGLPEAEIKEGAEARITIFEPTDSIRFDKNHIYSTSKNSMFLGEELKGKVLGIITGKSIQLL
ncbi:dihydroorotase [Aurantibacter crassamenti]|uniref:dihydroorotase n=1 Tax=Aurantibacter crassamenti TaxID=1837375 RepID=UPI0019394F4E|nr:dihydroorotase [Aurantibacter crassamenti]MBM1107370.1 dihydroorotase [Aurantibacter crassamenti]